MRYDAMHKILQLFALYSCARIPTRDELKAIFTIKLSEPALLQELSTLFL